MSISSLNKTALAVALLAPLATLPTLSAAQTPAATTNTAAPAMGTTNAAPAAAGTAVAPAPVNNTPAGSSGNPSAAAAAPSDGQIAGIVSAANKGEIAAGEMASKKASNKAVKAFAKDMVKDHKKMQSEAESLLKKQKIALENSDSSAALTANAKAEDDKLKDLKGASFDKAYVDAQVADHEAVLDKIDHVLLPAAHNAALKAMLGKARVAVAGHLEHAKKVQAGLNGTHS